MIFTKHWRKQIEELINVVSKLQVSVNNLDCEAGRHHWITINDKNNDPKFPPYLRCNNCWKLPEEKNK